MNRHTPAEIMRLELYLIRRTVATDGHLSLRDPDGDLDVTAIAIESTMRENAGILDRAFIHELDAPPELRNPAPWRFCLDAEIDSCPQCPDALAVGLPGKVPRASWFVRMCNALAGAIDDLTAGLIRRGH